MCEGRIRFYACETAPSCLILPKQTDFEALLLDLVRVRGNCAHLRTRSGYAPGDPRYRRTLNHWFRSYKHWRPPESGDDFRLPRVAVDDTLSPNFSIQLSRFARS
jgi:hypothetical protein